MISISDQRTARFSSTASNSASVLLIEYKYAGHKIWNEMVTQKSDDSTILAQ